MTQLSASNIVLIDATGQQLLNTLTPYGTPLPRRPDVATLRQVIGARQPSVSNLIRGPLTQLPLVRIEVPVIRDGQALYALAIGLFPEELGQILTKQTLPPGWIATLFDASGAIVARTRNADQFVAGPGAPGLAGGDVAARERLRDDEHPRGHSGLRGVQPLPELELGGGDRPAGWPS